MPILARVLADLGHRGTRSPPTRTATRASSATRGRRSARSTARTVAPLADAIERMMARKSENEIALIRESGRWCAHAHRLLQEYTRPGVTEAEASLRAGHEATLAMLRGARRRFGGQLGSSDGASGGLPRPDRPAQLVGARDRAQHRVPAGRRARHRDGRADLGLQRRARARDGHRPADATRCAGSSTTRSRRSRSRSTRSGRASPAPTSTAP